jgi:hypothetical protein
MKRLKLSKKINKPRKHDTLSFWQVEVFEISAKGKETLCHVYNGSEAKCWEFYDENKGES